MNLSQKILAALISAAASCSAFADSSLSFQDVTFSTQAVDSDTLRFTITGADTAGGDWLGVQYLKAFSFKDIGDIASFAVVSGPSFASIAESGKELNAKGCTGGNSGGACFSFTQATALTSSMTWTIDFVAAAGQTLNFAAPHLKVDFYTSAGDKKSTGSLLSQSMVSAVPEPETFALLLAGLGLVGAVARRRQNRTR
ncbi:PEP-CTERM sorting domain-containing protein [Rhodoferax sp. AJA081-3]|uniref:PEP-CTERM sorting domain-containing protein n=1 Tax=Rhodoferax sp. AJA081-3 TaxID=2752316 RepID=UPI001FD7F774|nr:PEP-CTERM sorting domain-containing protein [Rhodoferax sp. AJA081-3]